MYGNKQVPGHVLTSRKQAVFWVARDHTRGSTLVRVRVRTYAAKELAVFYTAGGRTRRVRSTITSTSVRN